MGGDEKDVVKRQRLLDHSHGFNPLNQIRIIRSSPACGKSFVLMGYPMLHKLPAVVLTLAATVAYGQEIYSWKDASGGVHYSDMPPAEAKVRTLRKAPLAPEKAAAPADGRPAPPSLAERELAFKKRRASTAEAEEKANNERTATDARQKECSEAKAQLLAMQDGQRVARFAENGERVVMDDAEHEAEVERLSKYVTRNCK